MPKIENCAGIIPLRKIDSQWQVLLALHVKGNYWAFPKGHYEKHETPKEGAVRELFEETHLSIETFLNMPSLKEDYLFKRGSEEIHKQVEYFPALVKGELILQEPHEIIALQWFSLDEAEKTITFEQGKVLFRNFKQLLINNV